MRGKYLLHPKHVEFLNYDQILLLFYLYSYSDDLTVVAITNSVYKSAEIFLDSIDPIVNLNKGLRDRSSNLNDGDVQEGAPEADDYGGGSHDGRAGEEPHAHGESRNWVPTCYDPRLQCHEQSCINNAAIHKTTEYQ